MINEILVALAGLITTAGAWFFGRGKYKAEVDEKKIDNEIKLSSHYKEVLDDLKSRYETRYLEFEQLMQKKITLLEQELTIKEKKIKELNKEVVELRKENRILRNNANKTTS